MEWAWGTCGNILQFAVYLQKVDQTIDMPMRCPFFLAFCLVVQTGGSSFIPPLELWGSQRWMGALTLDNSSATPLTIPIIEGNCTFKYLKKIVSSSERGGQFIYMVEAILNFDVAVHFMITSFLTPKCSDTPKSNSVPH